MDNSPLGRLSPELRNQIFAVALQESYTINLSILMAFTGLTRTCRQIRAETHGVFYSNNAFDIILRHEQPKTVTSVCRWLSALNPHTVLRINALGLAVRGKYTRGKFTSQDVIIYRVGLQKERMLRNDEERIVPSAVRPIFEVYGELGMTVRYQGTVIDAVSEVQEYDVQPSTVAENEI